MTLRGWDGFVAVVATAGKAAGGGGNGIRDPRFAQLGGSVARSSQLRTRAWHRYAPGDSAPQGGSPSCVTLPHAFRTRAWHRYVREETALAEVRPQSRGSSGGGEGSGVESRWVFSIRSRAHSSAGERPLHTREVPGSIPGAPMASQAALRGSGRLRGGAWSVRWPAERRDTTRRGIWTTRAHLDVNTFSLLPVDAESSLSVR